MFSLSQVITQIKQIILRFPLSALCLGVFWICMVSLIWLQSSYYEEPELLYSIGKLMMMCALGRPLFTSVYLTHEWYGLKLIHKTILLIALCVFLIAYYFTLPGESNQFGILWGLQYALFTVASYLSIFLISREHTRTTARIILTGLIIGRYYALILSIGLSIVFWGTNILLNISIDSNRYATIWSTFSLLVGGTIFLGHIPHTQDKLPIPTLPFWIQNFVAYVLMPLATMYSLLLIVYIIGIIVDRNWPINEVIIWIFIFGIVLIVSIILSAPLLLDKQKNSTPQKLIRIGSILLLIFSSVAILAIMQRIPEFGITEPRYFVLILIVFFVWSGILYLRNPSTNLRWTISVFVVLTLLSAVGPRSATSVTTRSQLSIFESRARALGMLDENNKLTPRTGSQTPDSGTVTQVMRLRDSINRIFYNRDHDLIKTYLTKEKEQTSFNQNGFSPYDLEKLLKIDTINNYNTFSKDGERNIYRYTKNTERDILKIEGYSFLVQQISLNDSDTIFRSKEGENQIVVTFNTEKQFLTISNDGGSETIQMKPFIEHILASGQSDFSEQKPFILEGSSFLFMVQNAAILQQGSGAKVTSLNGMLLVR